MANKKKNNKSKINIYWFYASIIFFILSIGLLGGDNGIQNIQQTNISSFENYLRNGDIEKVAIINQRYARITLNENALEKDIHRGVKSENFLNVKFDYNEKVYNEFPKNNLNIPFPQLDVNINK